MRTVLYCASKSISVCRACLRELLSSDRLEEAAPVKANSSHRHPEIQNTDADWKPKLPVLVTAFWTYVFKVCSCVVIGRYLDVHLLQVQDKETRNMVTRLLPVFLAASFKRHKFSLQVSAYGSVKGLAALWSCALHLLWIQSTRYAKWKAVLLLVIFQGSLVCITGHLGYSYHAICVHICHN